MKDIINFLYESIKDTQGVIRGQDVKCGYLLAILFAPLVALDKINPILSKIYHEGTLHCTLLTVALIFWVGAGLCVGSALYGIGNPSNRITANSASGVFYGGELFKLSLVDALLNFRISASHSLADEIAKLPATEAKLTEELTFEKMKLAYIRSVKLHRVNYAIRSILIAVALIVILYIVRKV